MAVAWGNTGFRVGIISENAGEEVFHSSRQGARAGTTESRCRQDYCLKMQRKRQMPREHNVERFDVKNTLNFA